MQLSSVKAQTIIDGAEAKARELGLSVVIAVLDAGAHLKAFRRMDAAIMGSIDIAIRKASGARNTFKDLRPIYRGLHHNRPPCRQGIVGRDESCADFRTDNATKVVPTTDRF